MSCVCDPLTLNGHAFSRFIGENFKVCAYTPRDIISFVFGLINIVIWLGAQSPQLWTTYKNKSGGNISLPFLIIWLIGDIANLIGCIFTNQAQVQLYTAIYFIIMDAIVLGQIIYYETWYKKQLKKKQDKIDAGIQDISKATEETPLSPNSPFQTNNLARTVGGTRTPVPMDNFSSIAIVTLSIIALSQIDFTDATPIGVLSQLFVPTNKNIFNVAQEVLPICNSSGDPSLAIQVIGTLCAWICGILYFTARIPQVVKIQKEKNAYGVSFALFAMSFAANCFYATSILLPDTTDFTTTAFWRDTFPYLIGSIGANIFSAIVIAQMVIFGQKLPVDPNHEQLSDVLWKPFWYNFEKYTVYDDQTINAYDGPFIVHEVLDGKFYLLKVNDDHRTAIIKRKFVPESLRIVHPDTRFGTSRAIISVLDQAISSSLFEKRIITLIDCFLDV